MAAACRSPTTMFPDLLDRAKFVDRAHHVLRFPVLELPAGEIHVLLSQARDDLLYRDAQRGQPGFIQFDVYLLFQAPVHARGGNALEAFQIQLDMFLGQQTKGDQTLRSVEPDPHNRIQRRVETQQDRFFRPLRKLQPVQLFPDVERCEVHVRTPGELHHHFGHAGTRR